MQHVSDHFSYSQNMTWLRAQGYPLLKGVTAFWLSQLQQDAYTHDGMLVFNLCNSPEHGPTTFACTHYQQLLHQLFATILSLGLLASDSTAFLTNVSATLAALDKGLHISSWGGVREWKLQPAKATTSKTTRTGTCRTCGTSTRAYRSRRSRPRPRSSAASPTQPSSAVVTNLWSRGPGNGPDANAGWEKVWRVAYWGVMFVNKEGKVSKRFNSNSGVV